MREFNSRRTKACYIIKIDFVVKFCFPCLLLLLLQKPLCLNALVVPHLISKQIPVLARYKLKQRQSPLLGKEQQIHVISFLKPVSHTRMSPFAIQSLDLSLLAKSTGSSYMDEARRGTLLSRTGPYFNVDRRKGTIEFGATANLVTQLHQPGMTSDNTDTASTIISWLQDENRGLAMSIWDPSLMKDLGNNVYRLQVMSIQFVTITLAPWVDIQMYTQNNNGNIGRPEFIVQSVAFDPNIQILPGMRINADSLGIVIEVAGVLRPGPDGTSVVGGIAFQTSGILPPPMRLLPDPILKAASDTINQTIVNFAIKSFQKGAKANYQDFVRRLKQQEIETTTNM